ncbi:sporangiospore maturation cell wall hydrolase GsmA [Glycomyces sp. TRM65418]|uniref:sporangiospore maturation cell wall hydrolase GsmA n=1 Tax=Glycomyces sp. TRM65418 TaxID=2867006 RepID=UPI001CE4F8C8|nr:sporangiospore maturation cell wall hydrolase GsmA [Glycomyces sp. TRM65418]MCC3764378.1 sporangiospore maturation cell wall hydrolase GsmA [Glycomyces sp. TRM65418]QZD54056.1 sporangiospore maturation cell wall hydrolase GsmA [Glycomyces sp. TRM65418]
MLILVLAAGAILVGAAPSQAKITGAIITTEGGTLNVRSGPATDQKTVGTLANRANPEVFCKVRGEEIDGHVRTSSTWLRIGKDRWISEAYVTWSPSQPVPWCSAASKAATEARVTTAGGELNVRSAASSGASRQGGHPNGAIVGVECQVWGQQVDGTAGKTGVWYKIGDKRYVSAAYIKWTAGVPWLPWCGQNPPTVPRGGNQGFIDTHAPAAQASDRATGVPASVTLAQAILETGWGRGALAREDHNLFGMKCFGSPGKHAIGCRDYATFECSPTGGCFDMNATFRAYADVADSYRDHGELLANWSRYATAMQHADDPKRFAKEIHKAGYATDPKYAEKLIGIMDDHDLYRFD